MIGGVLFCVICECLVHSQGSREQLAIAEFARSLLVIPKTLAVNAAQDSTDLVAKLRAFHNEAQVNPERKNLKWSVCYVTRYEFQHVCLC
jgi:chaperonin GroEL (HSP60 family)